LGDEHNSLGHNWVDNFLNRHHDELQTHWSKPLDTQHGRASSLNSTNVKLQFDFVKENIVDKGILPHNIYGMDESRAIITICTDGTVLQLTIMFKGQNFMNKWGNNNVAHGL